MKGHRTVGFLAAGAPPFSQHTAVFATELRRNSLPGASGVDVICGYAHRGDCYVGLASELLERGAEVIVAANTLAARAARGLTDSTPIVMLSGGDRAHTGLRAENVVSMCPSSTEVATDRVRWLQWAFPSVDRVAVLWNPRSPAKMLEYDAVAAAVGNDRVQDLAIIAAEQIERRFDQLDADALLVLGDYLTGQSRDLIIGLAAVRELPAMYSAPDMVESGGLIGYGPDRYEAARRGAACVAQILAGAPPADVSVSSVEPELVVNRLTEQASPRFRVDPAVRQQARLVA